MSSRLKQLVEKAIVVPKSVTRHKSGGVRVQILAKPGAKQNAITNIDDDSVGVQIAAPPREGAANEELVEFIADVVGSKKRDVTLEAGSTSRTKAVLVSSYDEPNDVYQKLLAAIASK